MSYDPTVGDAAPAADPVPPAPELPQEKNRSQTVLILVGVAAVGCICFACGIVFGIWAWENGDSWFTAVPPVLSLL